MKEKKEVKIVRLPAIALAGFVLKTRAGENTRSVPAFWKAYMEDGRMRRLHGEAFAKKHAEYGACLFPYPGTDEFDYMIGLEVLPGTPVPAGYEYREIPPASYAVFTTKAADEAHFPGAIQECWGYAYGKWLPESGYKTADGKASFEYYDERSMGESRVCDIYIPVLG